MPQFVTTWNPPDRTVVLFDFGALREVVHHGDVPPTALSKAQYDRLVMDFHDKFRIPYKEYGLAKLRLSDPRWPAMLDEIDRLTDAKLIGLRGSGAVWLEEPPASPKDKNNWFELSAGSRTFKSPSRVREGDHFLHSERSYVASQRFEGAEAASATTR